MANWFPKTGRELRLDKNPFSILWSKMVVGDLIFRVDPSATPPYHYSFLVLKNRKLVIHLLRMDQNANKIVRYTALTQMDCICILREGVECFNYGELIEASK